MSYELLKWLHILSSALLLGTGLGSAYYLFFSSRSGDAHVAARVTALVVWADWLFAATPLLILLLSGWLLAWVKDIPLYSLWLLLSTVLLVLAGACLLPAIWLHVRMRSLARRAASENVPLPPAYWRLLSHGILLGMPALLALLVGFYLMVARPG